MKYLKLFEHYVPFGDCIVNDDIKSEFKVKGFINYYKLSNSVLNIWKGMIERYNKYPIKLSKDELIYLTKDNCVSRRR